MKRLLEGLGMNQIEMGGYLPLELNGGCPRFQDISPDNIFAVNTGRTAIWCAVLNLKAKRIHVPYYYCTDVIKMLQSLDLEVIFYNIDENFMPLNITAERGDVVLLVNYYGIMNESVCRCAEKYEKVILDQSHGYYYEPVLRPGIMNVYSCRKFVGVADGAYLIGLNLEKPDIGQDESFGRTLHLCKSIELGTNAAYKENKDNESYLEKNYLRMSVLTQKILENADDADIIHKRCANFSFLHEKLKRLQKLHISEDNIVPYMYPLLLDKDIHRELVQRKIYTPVLWSYLMDEKWKGTLEQRYAGCLIPLPVDQRYSEKEMEYLVNVIYSLI